jgi:hypothetical protein
MEKETQLQRGPLCASPAEYRWVDSKNTKHFYCTNCAQFRISISAEKRLEQGPTSWKMRLSKMALDHPSGQTLVITRPEDKEYIPLSQQYVKDFDLPQ